MGILDAPAYSRTQADSRFSKIVHFDFRSDGGIDLPFGFSTCYPKPPTTGVTVRYVNTTTGSDGNSGLTSGSAKATIAAAIASGIAAASNGPVVVYITAPITNPAREVQVMTYGYPIWLASTTAGTPWYTYASSKYTTGWTSDGSGVYHQAHSTDPKSVWITDWLDANGFATRLKQNTATPTTPAAGEFGYSAGNLYVNLPDGSDPATHTIEAPRYGYAIQHKGAGLLTVVDCVARFGTVAPLMVGGASDGTGRAHFIRCVSEYGGQQTQGAMFSAAIKAVEMVCIDCRAHRSLNDGFDAAGNTGVSTKVLLWGCDGSYNQDQGVSPHQDDQLYIVGSRFSYNGDGGLVAVDRTHTEIYNSQFDNNMLGQNDNGLDRPGRGAGIDLYHATCTAVIEDVDIAQNQGPGFTMPTGTVVTFSGVRSGVANGNTSPDRWDL